MPQIFYGVVHSTNWLVHTYLVNGSHIKSEKDIQSINIMKILGS